MELPHTSDFSAQLTQENFTQAPESIPTAPAPWASRRRPLTSGEIKGCRCNLGELRWLATVSRPDIRARCARFVARANSLLGSNAYPINELVITEKGRQRAKVSEYATKSRPITPARGDVDGRTRARGEKVHCGTMALAGWPDADYGGHKSEGKCRLCYAIGLATSIIRGSCHLLQWASKFARELAEGSLGGKAHALS